MAFSYKKGIKKILEHLGGDSNPAYVVVAIATAKGIFRPLFTMMDRTESPETKKYTALREGLTEVIAIPTYLLCGTLAGKGAALVKDAEKAKIAKHNLRFVGVCTAALVVIPGLCSLVIKPFTDRIFHKNDKKNEQENPKLDITSKSNSPIFKQYRENQPAHFYRQKINLANFTNTGMRVG